MAFIKKYDTVWPRFVAGLIDGLIFLPLSLAKGALKNDLTVNTEMMMEIGISVLYTTYMVIGHGKYGQTVGKKVMKVKVFDISEEKLLGYWRAFLREAVGFIISLAISIYYIETGGEMKWTEFIKSFNYGFLLMMIPMTWFLLEIVTALTNKKRRAIHDFIAGSVVVQIEEIFKPPFRV